MMQLTLIIVFSALFLLTHLVMSHGWIREGLVTNLGTWPFRALYSVISLVTLGAAGVIWWDNRHLGPLLWELPSWAELLLALPLTLVGLVLLVLAFATPSPTGMIPASDEARGVLRITRHPLNTGIALWALAHVIVNGYLGDVAFFGNLLLLGTLGAWHQDVRKRRTRGESFRQLVRETSILPFVAILTRRNQLVVRELPAPMILLAVAGWVALVVFHGRLFGSPVV